MIARVIVATVLCVLVGVTGGRPGMEQTPIARVVEVENIIRWSADSVVARIGREAFEEHVRFVTLYRRDKSAEVRYSALWMFGFDGHPFAEWQVPVEMNPDGTLRGRFGLPDCANHPEWCELRVDLFAARRIAQSRGIVAQPDRWETSFHYASSRDHFLWNICNMADTTGKQGRPRTFLIDSFTGEVIDSAFVWD